MSNYGLIFLGFILLYLLVIWKAGKTYPIFYLFIFTYFLQYIFSTYLMYNVYKQTTTIRMAVPQDQYFEYSIPALLSLFAGVFLFNKDLPLRHILKRINAKEAHQMGYLLLAVSLFFDALPMVGINAFNSILSFTHYLKYVAVFCFLFTNSWINYVVGVLIYVQLALVVLGGGVFIEFINWATYLFFFVSLKFELPFLLRSSFILVAIPILILIQTVKYEYRKATWTNKREAGVDLFSELAEKKKEEDADVPFTEKEGVISTVARLNEGWHLSLTLNHIPKKEPIANGSEMLSDLISSILPRVLFADKKTVHTKEKFRQYTGIKLRGSTSMTIGLLGDFYINYGVWGSFIMLFIFGIILSKLLQYFLRHYVIPEPINIIWVPFMLSYLIRADNDFYIIFNCLVKGFLVFLAINYLRKKYFFKASQQVVIRSNPTHS